jgi:hypothetical protein
MYIYLYAVANRSLEKINKEEKIFSYSAFNILLLPIPLLKFVFSNVL